MFSLLFDCFCVHVYVHNLVCDCTLHNNQTYVCLCILYVVSVLSFLEDGDYRIIFVNADVKFAYTVLCEVRP